MPPPCRIYLADLGNTYYGVSPGTIPLAGGYLAAYLRARFGGAVDVRVFRALAPLLEAMDAAPPDVAGFGIYAWNPRLTALASRLVKERNPRALTVAGGPAVELRDALNVAYFARSPHMDFLVRHEGELALANLVASFLEHGDRARVRRAPIDGVWFMEDGALVGGTPVPQITPLEDVVPSPYLSGLFDAMLEDAELMPLVQTTRGCPYSCTFCVSGQPVYNRLRSFDVERVKEEIRYLRSRARNRSIRFTDDNFGLLERDVEIARFVRDLYDAERYPAGLKIYYGKLISERIKECAALLKPLLPLCMSFQSLTPEVLEEIKRPNNTREKFEDARRWARANDVTVATELIFGMPRETYASWVRSLDGVVDLRVDSVFPTGMFLLEGAELNTPEARERYGFRTKFCLGADGITQFDGVVSVEYEEFVVATKWMTEEEFYRLNQLRLFAMWFVGYGFFKEILYHAVTSGLTLSGLFEEILARPDAYPVFHGLLQRFGEDTRATFFETRADVDRFVAETLARGEKVEVTRLATVYVGKMIARKDEILDELEHLLVDLHRRQTDRDDAGFAAITGLLARLTKDLLVPLEPEVPEAIAHRSRWDLVQWRRDDYQRPLADYAQPEPVELHLVMNNLAQTRMTNAIVGRMSDENLRMQYYLRNTNSSNIRRQIVRASDAERSVDRHLLNLEGFADAAHSVRPDEDFAR
jgi:radical SAM superfamily enzyme YgiQ (UPF0313 family)